MKVIEAVINRPKLEEVRCALDDIGVEEFMQTEIITHSRNKGQVMSFRGARFIANLVEKVKLEIIAADESAEKIIQTISSITGTERMEPCRIAIRPYLEVT